MQQLWKTKIFSILLLVCFSVGFSFPVEHSLTLTPNQSQPSSWTDWFHLEKGTHFYFTINIQQKALNHSTDHQISLITYANGLPPHPKSKRSGRFGQQSLAIKALVLLVDMGSDGTLRTIVNNVLTRVGG